jgi:hypothetical protein
VSLLLWTLSSSTSSTNLEVIENLILHCLVTCNLVSSHTHPKGYGHGCGLVSSPNFFTTSSDTRLSCDQLSTRVSILTCFVMTLMWKSSFLLSSTISDLGELELVLTIEDIPRTPMGVIIVSSPESDPRFC